DTITDFVVDDDLIVLSAQGFGGQLPSNATLAASAFSLGSAATANHRVIYNPTSGALLFDPDGIGSQQSTQIATLSSNLALTSDNIFIEG
ncbi:MAG: hypothetical protein AAGF93_17525, partial [Cyanobacteria bacterium P01_H01_bin.105]